MLKWWEKCKAACNGMSDLECEVASSPQVEKVSKATFSSAVDNKEGIVVTSWYCGFYLHGAKVLQLFILLTFNTIIPL